MTAPDDFDAAMDEFERLEPGGSGGGDDCLGYSALEELAGEDREATGSEQEHLGACLTCRTFFLTLAGGQPGHPWLGEDVWNRERERAPSWAAFCRRAREPGSGRSPSLHLLPRLLAAAAVVLAVSIPLFVLSRSRAPERTPLLREASAAVHEADLFLTLRAPPSGSEYHAGFVLEGPAHVRLVASDEAGALHEIQAAFFETGRHASGPHPTRLGERALEHLLVLVTPDRIADDVLARDLSARRDIVKEDALMEFAASYTSEPGAGAMVVALPRFVE